MRPLTIATLAALLVAGCATPTTSLPPSNANDPATSTLTVMPFGLNDCWFAVAIVPVNAADLAPYMPDGFVPSEGNAIPPSVGGVQSFLGLETFDCADEGLGDTAGRHAYASVFTGATPPPELANGTIDEYYVKWDTIVANEATRTSLADAGFPGTTGTVSLRVDSVGPVGRLSASVEFEGGGGFQLEATGSLGAPREGFEYIEYAPSASGTLAAWHSRTLDRDFVFPGSGVVTVEESSWYAELTGLGPIPTSIAFGRWSFEPGNITFPVRTISDVR